MREFREPSPNLPPGETVAFILAQVPPEEHPELLAHLEKQARKDGRLDSLREIRAYKAKHNL